ncbi:unnamed protein product [Clavelina lepadiformis]|uniref:Lipocalin/cytosolic fatty-acid binding domain-containing protein n=1 Tax=Clavelina lepadiformis TaxID=159417 RepID=A0ABP0F1A4_CLALP
MVSPIFGKWKLEKNENFAEYMKKIGVNIALRKMGALASSTSEITDEGDNKVRINTQSTFKSTNRIFPIGEEIEEQRMDGQNVKTTTVWEGNNKLHQIQLWDNRKAVQDWIYEDGKLILRLECEGVVCTRINTRCE